MRFAGAMVAVLVGGACARGSAPLVPPPLVPAPLAWTQGEGEAIAALERAGMAPRSDARHAYVSTPEQFHAAPGTIEVAHTVEPIVLFTPRAGWTGMAHYPTVGGALDEVALRGRVASTAVGAELDALVRRLGAPDDARALAGGTLRRIWVRGGVWLVALVEPDGTMTLTYRRDARAATEIGP